MTKKVALVTGASAGMGVAFAKILLAEGYIVYGAARRVDKMSYLKDAGGYPLKLDIAVEADIEQAVKTISQAHGGIDILVNNAGFGLYGAVEDISIDDARYQFEVNIFGLARLTQLALPHMRAKRWGKIINISSVGGRIFTPMGAWYHATKHALEGWSDCLRIELEPHNIDVVIIEPGLIQTEFGDVVSDRFTKYSASGAYTKLAQGIQKATADNYKPGAATPSETVAKVLIKAVRANKPKTRYAIGKYAFPLLFMRRWLSDRMFQRVILSFV